MPIDAYSLCPGGTGKKIKFCCPDFLAELQNIQRMLEGNQQLACLQHIDRLLQPRPERACLLAIKGMLLRATDQWEAAAANAAFFLEKQPDNTTAMAESAMATAAVDDPRAAMQKLQQAIAACCDGVTTRVYEAIGDVAAALLASGHWQAGRALLQFQLAVAQEDRDTLETLVELHRTAAVPVLLKDDPPMASCPQEAPWRARFEEAMVLVASGRWQGAADRFAVLAAEVPESPTIWRSLATLRGWLADTPGCIEALRRLAALDLPLEDAVEAETLAMILSDDPLGDLLDVLDVAWTVKDSERLQTALLSDARVVQVPVDAGAFADGDNPPPKGAYLLLDRPLPKSAENLTLDVMASVLGQMLLFGRQTDREARLEVPGITAADLPQAKDLLARLDGEALHAEVHEERVGQVSTSREMLQRKWLLPGGISPQQLQALAAEHQRHALLQRWPQLKLGILGGKSPGEVAAQPACRVKLLAAVMLLSIWSEGGLGGFDFNQLRSQLELPTLLPIDPRQTPWEGLPLVRLSRVMVEELGDEALLLGYRRAVAFHVTAALRKFARAVIARPSLAGRGEQLRAYRTLAESAEDPEQALQYVDQGRKAAEAAGQSSASWDLWELSLRFGLGDVSGAVRLVEHVQGQHVREPGVAEALTRILVQVGLLHPDGTPAVPHRPPQALHPADELPTEPGKLWTPDSQQPGGKGKIWVPE
jgi:hypothetical protein